MKGEKKDWLSSRFTFTLLRLKKKALSWFKVLEIRISVVVCIRNSSGKFFHTHLLP